MHVKCDGQTHALSVHATVSKKESEINPMVLSKPRHRNPQPVTKSTNDTTIVGKVSRRNSASIIDGKAGEKATKDKYTRTDSI